MRLVLRERLSPLMAVMAVAVPAPIVAGDWPDPSVTRDGSDHVAVVTANGYAPIFRTIRSSDLRRWTVTGAVFTKRPRWAKTDFWAPEMFKLSTGRWAVFYSARPKNKKLWLCLGVATGPTSNGPWHDKGSPLRCGKYGSIDAYPTRDERGRLVMLWKEDGNAFKRHTPIFGQRMTEDGQRLFGRPKELIRNSRRWEGKVIEAPTVIRRGGFFNLIYSGGLCCSKKCAYAVGVARSKTLLGRYRKYNGNPILRGGNGWRCPGHTGITDDGAGGLLALFHAYRGGNQLIAGRQLLAAPLTFGANGWPAIGAARRPPPYTPGAASNAFTDDFQTLNLLWEWPVERAPGIATGDGLRLRANPGGKKRWDAGVLTRRVGSTRFVANAVLDSNFLKGDVRAGLAAYRSGFEGIGVAASEADIVVWQRRKGRFKRLTFLPRPVVPRLYLRMTAFDRRVKFEMSPDTVTWETLGSFNGPVEDAERVALTSGGKQSALVRFISASLAER
jgi:xylan 1,4-beta-xylosidase